ncbi:MAG: MarR family winged helix-turn-helix transcriptional regulator [Pigmentiphaga sp.]|nr:MarR family winged helix-turn-helix transcriptional regulator [Pigmentiphaga sp.]
MSQRPDTVATDTPAANEAFDVTRNLTYHIVLLASSLNRSASRQFQQEAGMTTPEWRLLAVIGSHGEISFNGLYQILDIDKGWISRTLVKLERNQLVVRTPDPEDGRQFRVRLTPEGEALRKQAASISLQRQAHLESRFSRAELDQLYHLLGRLKNAADELL